MEPIVSVNPIVLRDAPEVPIAEVALGLTLYTAEPLVWAREGAGATLGLFLELAPAERLNWFTTSSLEEWRSFNAFRREGALKEISAWHQGRARHLLWVRIVDEVHAPTLAFSYREVAEGRGRTGFLQILLPPETDPNCLVKFVEAIAQRLPFFSGLGGYIVSWNFNEEVTARPRLRIW